MARSSLVATLLAAALLLPLTPAAVQAAPRAGAKQVLLTLDGVPLVVAVRWMAKHTGRNFIVGKGLRHRKVTVVSGRPVTAEQAYEGFVAALGAVNLRLEPAGEFETIVRAPRSPARGGTAQGVWDCRVGDRIRRVGEREWTLTPQAYAALFAGDQCAATQARIVPHLSGGHLHGLKLLAIRPGSAFHKLGLHNGDLIERIGERGIGDFHGPQCSHGDHGGHGGHDARGPANVLAEAKVAKPKPGQSVEVRLVRRGEERAHTYRIVRPRK